MARIGRPKSPRAESVRIVRIKLRLYPSEDDDLIAFFGGIPTGLRAASVKLALRSGMENTEGQAQDQDDELMDALDAFIS